MSYNEYKEDASKDIKPSADFQIARKNADEVISSEMSEEERIKAKLIQSGVSPEKAAIQAGVILAIG
jgi:hypothetical protein